MAVATASPGVGFGKGSQASSSFAAGVPVDTSRETASVAAVGSPSTSAMESCPVLSSFGPSTATGSPSWAVATAALVAHTAAGPSVIAKEASASFTPAASTGCSAFQFFENKF